MIGACRSSAVLYSSSGRASYPNANSAGLTDGASTMARPVITKIRGCLTFFVMTGFSHTSAMLHVTISRLMHNRNFAVTVLGNLDASRRYHQEPSPLDPREYCQQFCETSHNCPCMSVGHSLDLLLASFSADPDVSVRLWLFLLQCSVRQMLVLQYRSTTADRAVPSV